jgi:superfamily I DNA/RNA helicase
LRRPVPQIAAANEAIQLLTCQKAKGLEWPVVIALGLARSLMPPRVEYPRIEEAAGQIAIHISSVTVDEDQKKPRELARREENQRLFYVTLTRAKSLLILPQSAGLYKTTRDSFLDISQWDGIPGEGLFDEPGTGLATE